MAPEVTRRFDLVIFDLDGTLADTLHDLASATNHALAELGCPSHPPARIAAFVGGGIRVLIQRALGEEKGSDPAVVDHAYSLFLPFYREHMLDSTRPYPGTEAVLEELHRAGVKMAIATNKPRMFTLGMVESLFPGRFDPVVACGDDVPRKPDPACVFRAMARHPGVPRERILFVGDSPVDVATASAAGVDSMSVTWGFARPEDLVAARPAYLADRPQQVEAVVLESER